MRVGQVRLRPFYTRGGLGVKDSGAGGAGWIFTYRRWYGLSMGVQAGLRVNGLGGKGPTSSLERESIG